MPPHDPSASTGHLYVPLSGSHHYYKPMKSTTLHPAEVTTSALILAALIGLVSCLAQSAELEDFKAFHVPAKHTLDTGQSWLYDGMILDGKPIHLNPHMIFRATGDWYGNPTNFFIAGKEPPEIKQQTTQCNGPIPLIFVYFDQPVFRVSFDIKVEFTDYLAIGELLDPWDIWNTRHSEYPPLLTPADGLVHVVFDTPMNGYQPFYGIDIAWGGCTPVQITNIQIESLDL